MYRLAFVPGLVAAAAFVTACTTPAISNDAVTDPVAVMEAADAYAAMDVTVHDGEFATIQQFTTPAGISVWLVEEPSIPILSLRMAWEVGGTLDPEGMEGLTDAMVYHMNEGAGDLDAQAYFKRMEDLNMSFGCSAGSDNTYCNASMLTDNAEESFEMIALAYAAPRFDDGPFERLRREQEINLKTRETSAGYLAGRAMDQAL
ncbi:MAG: hypothetical protein L3J02_07385 [Henriciella sp.]|nr:hypothetical protein [Henriciella sp.]